MDTFNYELKQLCRHNRDGSYVSVQQGAACGTNAATEG